MGSVQTGHDLVVGQGSGGVVGGQVGHVTVEHVVGGGIVGQGAHVTVGHVVGGGHVVEGGIVGHVSGEGQVGEATLSVCIMGLFRTPTINA